MSVRVSVGLLGVCVNYIVKSWFLCDSGIDNGPARCSCVNGIITRCLQVCKCRCVCVCGCKCVALVL